MAGPFISFLSDFGSGTAPGVCRGVIWRIAPDACINDLAHSVRGFAIREGAFLLSRSVPYLPVGVHLAVVDPGVGTVRHGIALRARRGDLLIGPDNGLLLPAADALGGVTEARAVENAELWLPEVSSTFHGRDIFAPVAAHLANGRPIVDVGSAVDEASLVRLVFPEPTIRGASLETSVLYIDAFGNCRLAGTAADLAAALGSLAPGDGLAVRLPDRHIGLRWVATFGEVEADAPLLYEDADYAGLALAINGGSAADRFGLATDDPVRIGPG